MNSPYDGYQYGIGPIGGWRPDSGAAGRAISVPAPSPTHLRAALADPHQLRKAQPANFLLPATKRWLLGLPGPARPYQLALHYPRLANGFAVAWPDGPSVSLLFDHLLAARSSPRRGFAPQVMADITALWDQWSLCPVTATLSSGSGGWSSDVTATPEAIRQRTSGIPVKGRNLALNL